MTWEKLGLVIRPSGQPWMRTHAMLPFAEPLEGDQFRVWFSGRDSQNRSHVSYAEIDLNNPHAPPRFAAKPVLSPGPLGCFDDNGVTPSWIVRDGPRVHLYYIGWNRGSTVRMHLYAGLAISDDGGTAFQRHAKVPILDRTDAEPFILTAPCVLREGPKWRMWYVSGIEWVNRDLPRYDIKYAESADGKAWRREPRVVIPLGPEEHALARPCVLPDEGKYRMWFAAKGVAYRMGYAESRDGLAWERKDHLAGIEPGSKGWDSEMIAYAHVFRHRGKLWMLYNGNNYGSEGIGIAVA